MGLIQCLKHGNQVIADTSPKIADYIRNDKSIDFKIVEIYLDIGNKENAIFLVDDDFAKNIRAKYRIDADKIQLDSEEDVFEVVCSFEPVCEKCYRECMDLYRSS
jgi:hypothetical protein